MNILSLQLLIIIFLFFAVAIAFWIAYQIYRHTEEDQIKSDELPVLDDNCTVPLSMWQGVTNVAPDKSGIRKTKETQLKKLVEAPSNSIQEIDATSDKTVRAPSMPPYLKAQFWSALNKPNMAINVLTPMLEENPAPNVWLFLLNTYVQTKDVAAYQSLREKMQKHFNIHVPAMWERVAGKRLCLTDFPDLMFEVNQALRSEAPLEKIYDMLKAENNSRRSRLDFDVFCDLVRLYEAIQNGRQIHSIEKILPKKLQSSLN